MFFIVVVERETPNAIDFERCRVALLQATANFFGPWAASIIFQLPSHYMGLFF
jgi:hypothetical protein